jgi:hypothetical protein
MTKRLCALMAIAAAGATLVAGCGGSSSSSSSAQPAAATSTASATSSSASPTQSTTTAASSSAASSSLASNPTIQAAVARCKQAIAAAPTLSSDAKGKLNALCDKAASGDEAAVLKAAKQVCVEVVKETVPSSAQDSALAACKSS